MRKHRLTKNTSWMDENTLSRILLNYKPKSCVSTVTRLWAGLLWFDPRHGQRFFSSPSSDRLWCPPSLFSNGYRRPFAQR